MVNHGAVVFIQNKRCCKELDRFDGVVNRNADSVYQTDAVLILIRGCANALVGASRRKVQSTSMFRKISFALSVSASCLCFASPASARDLRAEFTQQTVTY